MSARTTGQKPAKSTVGPVEKGVAMPGLRGSKGKYPWKSMKVGDSFAVDGVSCSLLGAAARSWVRYQGTSRKFAARTEGKGARIWRIK